MKLHSGKHIDELCNRNNDRYSDEGLYCFTGSGASLRQSMSPAQSAGRRLAKPSPARVDGGRNVR
jgi:hypothetical protein